ncbi:lysylphosphatidylglycerol synthase domain-containing protein [Mesorhizobium sp. RMAD-H1]|uniref:lysylphosphatidylglycerol synthase domain-containing protein n=1 Tax=Mesorhizobium sp. RMAD-H1 TaxID=2587065 RepID=UPI00160E33E7|nr:lysylphosphatidylglycerol synthase domain-containing protein [Mesorhizobium sp. RMAD-H1]MBB2972346.1 hypothetical protein [Mesorhizobium sp. RMAD-H1]
MTAYRLFFRLSILLTIGVAAYLLYRAVSRYSLDEIMQSVQAISAGRLMAALGFAAASYLCLTGFDTLAVRYLGKRLPYRRIALASFVSLSIGHNIGVAALSSGAVRYRFYSRWGLTAGDVAKIILFTGMTVVLGLATLGGIGLLLYPEDAKVLTSLGPHAIRALAIASLAFSALYLVLSIFVRKPFGYGKWKLELPPFRLAAGQIAVGTLNFAFVAACLYQLVAASTEVRYLDVVAIYTTANAAAIISHVPGGIGVLEAAVIYLLPGAASVGAAVAFRVVYFFVPLALGLPLLLISEHVLRKRDGRKTSQPDADITGGAPAERVATR